MFFYLQWFVDELFVYCNYLAWVKVRSFLLNSSRYLRYGTKCLQINLRKWRSTFAGTFSLYDGMNQITFLFPCSFAMFTDGSLIDTFILVSGFIEKFLISTKRCCFFFLWLSIIAPLSSTLYEEVTIILQSCILQFSWALLHRFIYMMQKINLG